MPRKTRSQTKAKPQASATYRQNDGIVHGISTQADANNAYEATMADIVRGEGNNAQSMPLVRSVSSGVYADRGDEFNCPGCDRPNKAERIMVQCQKCAKPYHFTCAKVSTGSTDPFTCVSCVPRDSAPPPNSISGRSSTSSARRARLARELKLLEEEKKMEEEAQREQLERERMMSERAAKEKIERDKHYLARKRDLLIQQDEEDDIASIRSHRSTRYSDNRVEDWIAKQMKASSNISSGVIEETSKPTEPTHHTPVNTVDAPVQQCHSTPIQYDLLGSKVPFPMKSEALNLIDIDRISTARTTGSITIGENEFNVATEGNVQTDGNNLSPDISLVDLQPLQNLLDEPEPIVSKTGTIPKLARNMGLPFGHWQSETAYLRKTHEIELRHQMDIEIRRKRELELVDQIKNLQFQKDANVDQLRRQETNVKKQLQEIADRQAAMELQWQQDIQQRDVEINRLRDAEQQLKNHLHSMSHMNQQHHAVVMEVGTTSRPQVRTDQPPFQAEEFSGISWNGNNPNPVRATPPIPITINANPQPHHLKYDHHPSISSTPIGGRSSYSDPILNPITPSISHPSMLPRAPLIGDCQPGLPMPVVAGNEFQHRVFRPTPDQLAARQVLSKELPIFAGDPIDWPLFFSSYRHSTETCGYSDSENLLRLQRALQGAAKDAVSSFLLHPSTVPQALSTLQILFGRPEQIVHTMIEKVRTTPPPKPDRLETLISFGLVVQNLCCHLKAVGLNWHLSNPTLLQELVDKLPANVKFNWALYQQQLPVVDLNVFGEYMSRVTSAASSVTLTSVQPKNVKDDRAKTKEKAYVNAHTTTERGESVLVTDGSTNQGRKEVVLSEDVKKCPACNAEGHQAGGCSKFKELSIDGRWNLVKECKLCRRCLIPHLRWPCKGEVCGVNGCQKLHHRLLHYDSTVDSKQTERNTNATVTIHQKPTPSILFRVLPVTLYGKSGKVNTFAFLDDGSSVTLVESTIADTLGLDGQAESLCIQWTSGINKKISDARMVQMEISAQGSNKRFKLGEAFTVNDLGLPEQSLNFEEIAVKFKHLRKLPVQSFQAATPGILIGIDNAHLLATLKLREGRMQEPIATKTRIGWAVYGRIRGGDHLRIFVHGHRLLISMSIEEQRARTILEESTVRTDCGKFETGLLWKNDYIELPDSWPMAEKRLKCLEKRLQRYPVLYETVRKQIAEFQFKRYVHEATKEELNSFDLRRTWYLPLGIVTNLNKPGKVRLIWDAAAKVDGVSLNDQLLKGPDLLTPLLAVLFQFREREVAISADIMEMFLQILIRSVDRSALLFLWRDSPDQPIKVMVTNVAIFGATCSPVQSQFVKNLNATEHEENYPKASAAIQNKHYVDDYLDSVDTTEEAVQLATEVATVHGKADFFIRNWTSNKLEVLERIGETNPAAVKRFAVGKDCKLERLLGMIWLPEDDVFSFDLCLREEVRQLIDGEVVPSKRELLSVVMSLYDPLGLVAAFVIHGKVLVQDTWREKIGWDDKIPIDVFCRWKQWLKFLGTMTKVKISRCYFPGYDPASYDSLQLHIFVDASTEAYAAVAYFRIVDRGEVRCSLVSSKTKVAPLQSLSIPRLELMAALIGSRLKKTIEEYHSVKITRTFLWSDSTTVVAWIRSDSRRYRQFVAFRVNEILSLSAVEEWRWIGTRANVADEATKWGKGPSTDPESRWYRGPAFLYDQNGDWLEDPVEETNEELRPVFVCSHFIMKPMIEFKRFSKFERLKRCVAYVHRYLDNLRRTAKSSPRKTGKELSREELQKAELSLWKLIQSEAFWMK